MSHIHLPDGVLPTWLWLSGYLVTVLLLAVALRRLRDMDAARKVPLLGVTAAAMIVTMSAEIVPIAYHVNMAVLAGVLLGPALGFVCAFIVDVILALLGHGGITVTGLNTVLIGTEIALGWTLFRVLTRVLGAARLRLAAALATVLTLAVTSTMLVGVVAVAGINPAATADSGALNPQTLRFENPFAQERVEDHDVPQTTARSLSLGRFAALIYLLGVPGWIIEALLVSFVVGFVAKVRPDLLGLGPPHPVMGEPVQDHGHH